MLKKLFSIGLIFLFVGIPLNVALYFFYPNIKKLKKENPAKTAFMEYRENEWRDQGKKRKIRQNWVKLSRVSPYVIKAVIISEDDKFWHHEGFDYDALQKAIEEDIKKKKFKVGGSTISQQLAKNLYLSPSKNPVRKIKEAILTWRIERALSKKRIIELYLNVAEWGEGIFGIEAAAHRYYGKPASALSAQEAAQLAAVLPNPRKYHPSDSSKFVLNRSERIYRIMVRRGIVIPDYEAVMKEPEEAIAGETAVLPTLAQALNSEDTLDDGSGKTVPRETSVDHGGENTDNSAIAENDRESGDRDPSKIPGEGRN